MPHGTHEEYSLNKTRKIGLQKQKYVSGPHCGNISSLGFVGLIYDRLRLALLWTSPNSTAFLCVDILLNISGTMSTVEF